MLVALTVAALFVTVMVHTPRCLRVGRYARGQSLGGW